MTTQNTHFEHNDVDATVVERQLAPENLEKLAETAQPAEATSTDANSTSTSVSAHVKIGLEQSVAQEEGKTPSVHEHGGATGQSVQANGNEQSETTQVISAQAVEAPALKFNQLPLASMEEEVRPFTDFIAEFRQAEARLNASVQHSEVFTLLTPAAEEGASPEEPVMRPETTQGGLVEAVTPIIAGQPAQEEKLQTPEVESQQSSVSPLLRPASRLRLPRHGTRHQPRENTPDAETKQNLSLVTEPVISASVTPASAEVADETPAEVEKPRPTRRYRFDRPSANKAAPAVPAVTPARIEENRSASTNNREAQEPAIETAVKAPAPVVSISEILAVKPVVLQEESIAEPVAHGRRQKQQERTKEQPAALQQPAVPVTEVAPAVQESPKVEEIAPEDLPPLEYAELQKATNSRRRRRHRSSPTPNANNNNDTAATVVPTPVQAAPVAPARPVSPASPASPISPAASQSSQYSIVSGYTVSQMNQGNDMSGPFMAPEPSPARGSLISREVRSPRAEILRSPAPTYPIRSNPQEGTLNTTVLNQFANVIGQAIQAQTDRMVTELRRVTQAPTNVTVSLPPFPSNERVGVFVDVANLLYSARTLRIGVDFGKLLDFLRGNRRLIRAQAYCPTSPQPGDEQMFLQAVKGLGYRITTKNYKTFSSGAKKADLDLDLCMDVVRLVDGKAVDCIVLVSGDSDFMPMLDYCSDHGVRVEVAAFDEAMSATLRQSCDLFVNLSQLEEIRA